MAPTVLVCPSCRAPLTPPSRFARAVTCAFCGAYVQLSDDGVSVSRYRESLAAWNDPGRHGHTAWLTVSDQHWTEGPRVAAGGTSDVFHTQRARWPTERALVRILRDPSQAPRFERAWRAYRRLHASTVQGAAVFSSRVPSPIAFGKVTHGRFEGRQAMVLRWARGFEHTLVEVRRNHPEGIDPRSAVWLWRRLLETLAFVHAEGLVHAAILPQHVLVEAGEHGAWLVGYGSADDARTGRFHAPEAGSEPYLPVSARAGAALTPGLDLILTARTVAFALGGSTGGASVPRSVPEPLAALVREVGSAADHTRAPGDAWELHERLGRLARSLFGPPSFHPIPMPR